MRGWWAALLVQVALLLTAQTRAQCPAELANNATCQAAGLSDALQFRTTLTLPNLYQSPHEGPVFLPLYASLPLDKPNDQVTTVLILLHGLSGDANAYFCAGMEAVPRALAAEGRVLVVVPWFGNQSVSAAYWQGSGPTNSSSSGDEGISAFWDTSDWSHGGDNSPEPARYTTSFDALDALIQALTTPSSSPKMEATAQPLCASPLFPNLGLVTVAGFSAGAQLTNRYSFATPLGVGPSTNGGCGPAKQANGVTVRFIASDASSYLYLDALRPAPACRPLRNTNTGWICYAAQVPPESAACPAYNAYKYSVAGIATSGPRPSLYFQSWTQAIVDAAVGRFVAWGKQLVFAFGSQDVCNCNTATFANDPALCFPPNATCEPSAFGGLGCCDTFPDGTNNALDASCSALVQGSNRLQRGLLYFSYLQSQSSGAWPVYGTFEGGHSNAAFYASAVFQKYAFAE